MAFFASDNTSGVSAEVFEAMQKANTGHAKAYGNDEYTAALTKKVRALFDHPDLVVFPAFNGSAANCLALAALLKPYEAVIAHSHSHIEQDECGMPEFFTGGKILNVGGADGKVDPVQILSLVNLAKETGAHHVRPKAISIAQANEAGAVYRVEEIKKLSDLAKKHDLYLHMDGARFANAIASLSHHPADMTWKAGLDVLSFGGTKNGAMLAEAIIFFNPALARDFAYIRKRSGQSASKARFISAQLLALINDGLWLKHASHANEMAKKLEQGLKSVSGIKVLFPVDANIIIFEMPKNLADRLQSKRHYFYNLPLLGKDVYRLVTSFATTLNEIDEFIQDCKH